MPVQLRNKTIKVAVPMDGISAVEGEDRFLVRLIESVDSFPPTVDVSVDPIPDGIFPPMGDPKLHASFTIAQFAAAMRKLVAEYHATPEIE